MTWARALVVLVLTSCSFVLVQGPPDHHEQMPYFECTESRVGPVLDTIWTAIMALTVISVAATSEAEWQDRTGPDGPSRGAAIGVYGVLGALGAAGMWYGFTRTSDCRDARQKWLMRQRPPGPWPPQPAGPGYPPQPGGPPPPGSPPPPGGAPPAGTVPPPGAPPPPSAPPPGSATPQTTPPPQ